MDDAGGDRENSVRVEVLGEKREREQVDYSTKNTMSNARKGVVCLWWMVVGGVWERTGRTGYMSGEAERHQRCTARKYTGSAGQRQAHGGRGCAAAIRVSQESRNLLSAKCLTRDSRES